MFEAEERIPAALPAAFAVAGPNIRRFLRIGWAIQDVVLVYVAVVAAYFMRFRLQVGPAIQHASGFADYQPLAALLVITLIPLLHMKGAYRMRMGTGIFNDVARVVSSSTTAVGLILVISYLLKQVDYSRGVVIFTWVFLMLLLSIGRAVARLAQGALHRRGLYVRRVVVVGASDTGKMLMQSIRSRPDLGYEIVGFVDRRSQGRVPDFGRFRRLGRIDDLPRLIHEVQANEIIVALPGSAHEELGPVVDLCESTGVGLKLVPDLFNVGMHRVEIDDVAGIPLVNVRSASMRRAQKITKRAIDLTVGLVAFILSLPVVVALAVMVRLDSPGPMFVRQRRIGKDGLPFTCYKLRSMHVGADHLLIALRENNEATGPIFKMRNDPRCTHLGRHLRRMSLDELPQIWNVLRGEMSLVGPRPPLSHEVAQYQPWHHRRLHGKPGITGIWQVSGRSNLTFDEMVMMDIMYLDNWTPLLDLNILLKTAVAVFGGRGAY